MNIKSHPEIEERERGEANGGPGASQFKCNIVLRDKLLALRETPEFSNSKIARRVGVSEAVISQYLSEDGCKYPGDIAKLELKIVDFLDNEARRRASGIAPIKSTEADQIRQALEYIRKTSDAGTILAQSGEGKTAGTELYVKENPTAIYYPVYSWANSKHDAAAFMFQVAGQTGYDNRTKREVHAVNKLRGCERLIIVDTAHNLHHTAFYWWLDFHMATQMPIAFVGIFKLLTIIEADPQLFSRIGYKEEISKKDAEGKVKPDRILLKHMIEELLPKDNNYPPELVDLCAQVAQKRGLYRSVHKQLKLAVEIRSGNKSLTWPDAFRAAHTKLIRHFDLN